MPFVFQLLVSHLSALRRSGTVSLTAFAASYRRYCSNCSVALAPSCVQHYPLLGTIQYSVSNPQHHPALNP